MLAIFNAEKNGRVESAIFTEGSGNVSSIYLLLNLYHRIRNLLLNGLAVDWSLLAWSRTPSSTNWQRMEVNQLVDESFHQRISSGLGSINWFVNPLINGLAADENPSTES